ncbi:MAG: DUF1501 domain-containing protein [Anaerolineales bacterium]|nr:DUF1501 domain-containing protein [Chloroflexota bacterium]MBL6982241.1 DUF1501 domain-containing protein [Anaerolineales bacterium]
MTKTITRREFLTLGAALPIVAAAPNNLSSWLPRLTVFSPLGVETPGDILVLIFQRGAMDGLSAVIPFTESEYYNQRPTLAIPEPKMGDDLTSIDLDGSFGLHPALRSLKDIWDDGGLAVVHACGSPDPTHSHFDAMDYMERGTPGEKSLTSGWLARHLKTAAWENGSPFRAVGIGSMLPSSLRGPVPALALQSITDFHLGGRIRNHALVDFQAALSGLYQTAPTDEIISTISEINNLSTAADLTFNATGMLESAIQGEYQPSSGALYPESSFGQAMLQVAQLIKADLGLEIAAVDIGGWDTHVNQGSTEGQFADLLTDLAGGISALYQDLGDLNKRVTIITMSEFGRRLSENGNAGSDHGHGNVMFVLGGGVNGGKVYTDWPGLSSDELYGPGDLDITTDFRDVLGEIVQKRLLNDSLEEIFPGYTNFKTMGIVKSV